MGSPVNHFCVQWNNHQKNLLSVMSELLQNNTLTDVTLGVDDGRSVDCHKTILAACSSYFQTLFVQYPCKHPFIVLSGVKYPDIMRIVEFMYKGEINVTEDELDSTLKVAAALQVKGLVDANQWSPEDYGTSSPEKISNDSIRNNLDSTRTNKHRRKSYSPACSTNKLYYAHEQSPSNFRDDSSTTFQSPTAVFNDLPVASGSPRLPLSDQCYSSIPEPQPEKKTSLAPQQRSRKRKMSREHVINRGVGNFSKISQGRTLEDDAETLMTRSENLEDDSSRLENSSTRADVKVERDDVDVSCDLQADHDSGFNNADNSPMTPFIDETNTEGTPSYGSTQTQEGKRYKKYSRNDLTDAIMAVKRGMSANKAATMFKVPSRTLYDKIKKLGCTMPKTRCNRSKNATSACFPYGIGGNVDGSIYGNTMENENDNSSASTDAAENAFELGSRISDQRRDDFGIGENTSTKIDDENNSNARDRSVAPSLIAMIKNETTIAENDNDNYCEAEDLTVSRKLEITNFSSNDIVTNDET